MDEPALIQIPAIALIVLIGPSGCGKSTFARERFRETEVVSSDRCRALVADDESDQSATRQAFTIFNAIVRARLSLQRLTIADATNLQPWPRQRLRDLANDARVPCLALLLDVPLELCHEQARNRSRHVRPEIIDRHFQLYLQAREAVLTEGFDAVHLVRPDTRMRLVAPVHRTLPEGETP
jgi:predicted kinase